MTTMRPRVAETVAGHSLSKALRCAPFTAHGARETTARRVREINELSEEQVVEEIQAATTMAAFIARAAT